MNRQVREKTLIQRVNIIPKKRSRTRGTPKKNGKNTRIYTFVEEGEAIQVCSKFFLGTLGFKKDNVISTLFKSEVFNFYP